MRFYGQSERHQRQERRCPVKSSGVLEAATVLAPRDAGTKEREREGLATLTQETVVSLHLIELREFARPGPYDVEDEVDLVFR